MQKPSCMGLSLNVAHVAIITMIYGAQLRYLDSTEEEQRRGITIHSSAISLVFRPDDKSGTQNSNGTRGSEFLINLIDCPGHIDFSSDVSTATRLCDGALILVDVLEGVCTQTRAVLFKAMKERMRPCLALNKVDRLCLELRLTPVEAFYHLRRIVENVNALAAQLVSSQCRSDDDVIDSEIESMLNADWIFGPDRGNIVFTSAFDCWGFGVAKFATLWAKKLDVSREVLIKYMFDDYAYIASVKKIVKCTGDYSSSKPLFASLILEPLWAIYQTAVIDENPEKAAKMASRALDISLNSREISTKDPRSTAQAIFRQWLPLSDAILRMVVRNIPPPNQAQQKRIDTFYGNAFTCDNNLKEKTMRIRDSVKYCTIKSTKEQPTQEDEDTEVVIFVTKMMPVKVSELAKDDIQMLIRNLHESDGDKFWSESAEEECGIDEERQGAVDELLSGRGDAMMALGRIFSGEISNDKDLYILNNRYNPSQITEESENGDKNVESSNMKYLKAGTYSLYICYGPSVYPVDTVPAGNIFGILGVDRYIFKTATISSSKWCQPMQSITFQAIPLVRVAVEPISHSDLSKLENGLASLYQHDPAVEIDVGENGQCTITCLGELHLEQCMKTLTEKICKCELRASEPLVPFKETTYDRFEGAQVIKGGLPPPWGTIVGSKKLTETGCYRLVSCGGHVALSVKCVNMGTYAAKYLEENLDFVSRVNGYLHSSGKGCDNEEWFSEFSDMFNTLVHTLLESDHDSMTKLEEQLFHTMSNSQESRRSSLMSRLLSFGSNQAVSNMLLFSHSPLLAFYEEIDHDVIGDELEGREAISASRIEFHHEDVFHTLEFSVLRSVWSRFENAIIAGFHAATSAGPLMQEAMYGSIFTIESIELSTTAAAACGLDTSTFSLALSMNLSSTTQLHLGQLIADSSNAFRHMFLSLPVRLVEPIYSCELQCDQNQLGNLYAVLSRRRGAVLDEDIIDGTTLFLISAALPVTESFGFAQELLEKTSGNAISPQLTFSHWEVLKIDPFWKPTTADELEEFGTQAAEPNLARIYIDKVRRRKGLPVEEKIVKDAEKQRNIGKNK